MEKPAGARLPIKRRKIFSLLLVLAMIAVAWLGYSIFAPLFDKVICTMETCLQESGITVVFVNQKQPENYSIQLESFITSQKITCSPRNISDKQFSSYHRNPCFKGGAFFTRVSNSPPEEVTVSVFIDDTIITKKFRPVYQKKQPISDIQNGTADCAPACYWATIEFDLSP